MLKPRFKGRWDKSHCGALLIQNRQRFEELYKDTAKARYDSGSLGNYLDHLYAVPLNGNGVAMLREIMLYTIRQSQDDSKEEAMDRDFAKKLGGVFELNDEFHDEIFQLKIHIDGSEDPTYFAIGNRLDIRLCQTLEKFAKRGEKQIGVICFEWQADYYRSVLPESVVVFYPD